MRVTVADVAFDNVTMENAVTRIMQMAQKTDQPRYVCTGNLDHLATIHQDALFRDIYREADLVLADGAPIVWLSRLSPEGPLKERVTGSDLFWELARASAATGVRLFFLGGQPCAAELAAEAARQRYPNAQVCGTYCPSFDEFDAPAEQERISAEIRAAQPDILLVGLGAPKQERWIRANKDRLGIPVSIGVGGTFEMAGGVVRRAPLWMRRAGMEWAYRFLQEPTRLWKRYFVKDLPFLIALSIKTILRRRQRRMSAAPPPIPVSEVPERMREVAQPDSFRGAQASDGREARQVPSPVLISAALPGAGPDNGFGPRRQPFTPPVFAAGYEADEL